MSPLYSFFIPALLLFLRKKFSAAWIGRNIKREVLAEHLTHLGKRLGEVPEFAAYAIADGIKRAFTRFGKWANFRQKNTEDVARFQRAVDGWMNVLNTVQAARARA